MKNIFLVLPAFALLAACHGHDKNTGNYPAKDSAASAAAGTASAADLKNLAFASTKDPACGMPLSAGLSDTANYDGKLYGFCSAECKAEFLKDPAGHIAGLKGK